jgi:hypothetical protein
MKNPDAPAVKREAEEDWGGSDSAERQQRTPSATNGTGDARGPDHGKVGAVSMLEWMLLGFCD